jgi:hypothetical protein
MKNIGGFFDKFNNKITRQVQNLDFIVQVIKKHTGISVEMGDLQISQGILRVKGTSLMRNEIFIKKTRILKDLEGKLLGLKVTDIK